MEYIPNQQIISEVNRYLELMGVEKKLITESSIFDEILVGAKKLFRSPVLDPRFPTKVFVNGEDITRTLFNKFKKILDGTLDISRLSSVELKKFIEILKNSDEVVNDVYNSTIENLIRNNPTLSEEKLLKSIQRKITGGEPLEDILKRTFNNDELSVGMLLDKFKERLLQLSKGNFKPDVDILSTPQILRANDGVQKFQKWMNKNYPNWLKGGEMSKKEMGNFNLETSTAWNKYKNEFLIPKSLGNKNAVIDFQNWMNRKYPKWYNGGKLPENKRGLYGKKTSVAWTTYGSEYKSTSLKKTIGDSAKKFKDDKLETILPPNQILSLASDLTLTNTIRKSLDFTIESLKTLFLGTQKQMDSIFSKIETALNSKVYDAEEFNTLYRQIGIQIMSLKTQSSKQMELLLGEIEQAIINTGKFKSEDVTYIINKIKSESAWKDIFSPSQKKYDTWFDKVIGESAWANFAREMTEVSGVWYEKLWGRFKILIKRSVTFLTTGHIRTVSEIMEFFIEKGIARGTAIWFSWMYVLKYIVSPFFYGLFQLLFLSAMQLFGVEKYKREDWGQVWDDTMGSAWSRNFQDKNIIEILNPFDWLWDNLRSGLDKNAREEYFNDTQQKLEEWGEKNGISKENMRIIKDNLSEDWKKKAEQVSNILRGGKNAVAEIMNTKPGFIGWCAKQKPPLTPDPVSPWIKEAIPGESFSTEYGVTEDGKMWGWDDKLGTFVPL